MPDQVSSGDQTDAHIQNDTLETVDNATHIQDVPNIVRDDGDSGNATNLRRSSRVSKAPSRFDDFVVG